MRVPIPGALVGVVMGFTACAPVPEVRTVVAPDTDLHSLQTFRVVEASNFLGNVQPGGTRPAFVNATTSRALGKEIAADLERRGYRSEAAPDVLVEYGTAVKEDLDPTDWTFNYLWRSPDWRDWGPARNDATPAEYAHGALVIDLVDAHTGQLVWRGHAAADPEGDERGVIRRLDRTVDTILDRLPGRSLALQVSGRRS